MSLDLDKRSKVINLCPWAICIILPNSKAEILLEANKTKDINNGELVTLADNEDVMLYGTGNGDHARVYVDNKDYREYVGFDNSEEKRTQYVLTNEECQRILDLKTQSSFEKNVSEKVLMRHEKENIMKYARKIKLNDYNKISYLEEYTGIKF